MIQLYTATSSLKQLTQKMDTISHNMSNLDTTAYKRQDALFTDALNNAMTMQAGRYEAGRVTPNGIRIGNGAVHMGTTYLAEQGSLKTTNRQYDMALMQKGIYFTVSSGGETFYTRSGSLDVVFNQGDNQNYLLSSSGDRVLDTAGQPIRFDDDLDSIQITDQGQIIGRYKNLGKPATVFNLELTRIDRPSSLIESGGNRFAFTGSIQQMQADGSFERLNGTARTGLVQQGALEQSNVDLTTETTEMIATQRLIQSTSRAISFADDMRGLINTINK
ncbi:flagellar hook-basal body protein [Chryseomicrobium excrementi]|uniref:Flagellar hook-basal body protein n=1 Tax=Chryseomicrobium excrementi TaxID=2041346 RepID=A0A2M9F0P8_9BACL|nr:flagellar hook-basal body protein [Chryseomicrobium excrementi]PJK17034.1 flagellar hook-basal body protein [Chryseomicrobium excrementi]